MLVTEAPYIDCIPWSARKDWDIDQSPLMVAVRARRPVGRGPDGKVEWAYALGHTEVARLVRAAVAMGADVNRRLHGAWPLMTYCAARGCLEAVKACLAAGAEEDARDNALHDWQTALVHAGYGGHEAVMEALLEAGASAKVGCRDRPGDDQTLPWVCGGQPTPGIVRRLAEAGADVNARGMHRFTALHQAAREGNLAVLEALADLGADMAAVDLPLHTAMHYAANGEVVRWLVAHGLSVQGNRDNDPPLQRACVDGRVDAVRALIELGADVHYLNMKRNTSLHFAVATESSGETAAKITRLLLASGADVSAVNARGWTPLCMAGHAVCVDLLLDAGADLEARDREGRTPICIASSLAEPADEVVQRMADRGADLVNTGGVLGHEELDDGEALEWLL